ncbi:MAG: terminase [Alphaproteobacteria bacterium]|nr:terminase [Alphaproteobacteria bacterium]
MSAKPRRSPAGDARFLVALENGHAVAAACQAAGYARASVYAWRREDPAFAAAWDAAAQVASDLLEEEADRRGRDGYDEAVFYRGEEAGTRRKYSDGLLLARLKALKPQDYRENMPLAVDQKLSVLIRDVDAEAALRKLIDENRLSPDELEETLRNRVMGACERQG